MGGKENGSAWGSIVAGIASIATLPVAIYLTRFSERYELLHAGFVIPLAAALGIVSMALAKQARRQSVLRLERGRQDRLGHAGRVLGIVGICLALAAVVALVVYGALEYVGSRD